MGGRKRVTIGDVLGLRSLLDLHVGIRRRQLEVPSRSSGLQEQILVVCEDLFLSLHFHCHRDFHLNQRSDPVTLKATAQSENGPVLRLEPGPVPH